MNTHLNLDQILFELKVLLDKGNIVRLVEDGNTDKSTVNLARIEFARIKELVKNIDDIMSEGYLNHRGNGGGVN